MYLTLEVVSPNAASMGANRRKHVGPQGARIGRAPENDWIIADPYISKEQARVTFVNGMFFIEGLGKNPVAVNNADEAIPNHEPRMLRAGDRLFVDQYEILVSLSQGEMPGAGSALAELVSPTAQPSPQGIPEAWDEGILGGSAQNVELDPLAALGGAPSPPQQELPPVNWQQGAVVSSHYEPPAPAQSSAPAIPDNWDRTSFGSAQKAQPPAPRPRVPTPAAAAPAPRPAQTAPAPAPPPVTATPPASPGPSVGPGAGPGAGTGADLLELLQGAGLPASEVSPEVLRELGQALRIVVQGVMDVLQARTEIKTQFRLPLTRVQPAQNNPLKFSPNVETALHTLLVERNRAYLSTVKSFEDAFDDIRHHQMAMLEGVREAFEHMLSTFDPEQLDKEFERSARRGGLLAGLSGKSKFQELYGERFAVLARDRDEAFRRLFGDCFGEAYERQLERLKTLSRNKSR